MGAFDYIIEVNIPSLGNLPLKEGSSTFKPNGVTREHIAGEKVSDGGYVETQTPAELNITIQSSPAIDVEALNAVKSENISITFNSGKSYTMTSAWSAEVSELSKGEISARFLSNESEQV